MDEMRYEKETMRLIRVVRSIRLIFVSDKGL
jgi:hypothetical protein